MNIFSQWDWPLFTEYLTVDLIGGAFIWLLFRLSDRRIDADEDDD